MDNQLINPQTSPRKTWINPELTVISRNYVGGGGPNSQVWERTGNKINEITTSIPVVVRQTIAATPLLYNSAAVHS